MKARFVVRAGALFVTLVAIGAGLHASGLADMLDRNWIDVSVRGQGLAGEALFVAAGAAATAIGVPRQVVAFLGGYAFGFAGGTALALLAATLGCVASFAYARLLGRDLVARWFPGKVRRVDAFLSDNPFAMTLLIRFLPVGNNLAVNLAAGVSRAAPAPFLLGSALGYVPQTAIFALVGSGIAVDPAWRIALAALLFAGSGALGVYLYRRYRHGRTLDEEMDRELSPNGARAPQ